MQFTKWTFLIIMILCSIESNAQFFSYAGTITLNNGEKITGRVKINENNVYNNEIMFLHNDKSIVKYKADHLKGFELENGYIYKSFEIQDKIKNAFKRKAVPTKRFLKCTVEGNINLYEFKKRKFIQKQDGELVEIFQYRNPAYLKENKVAEVETAKVIFSENEKIAKKYNRIYDKKIKPWRARRIIKQHNKAFNEPIKQNYLNQKSAFNVGLFYENLTYLNPQLSSAQIMHRAGLYSDFKLKGMYKNIKINAAFVHTYIDLDQETYTNPEYHPDIQYNSLWVGGSYHFWESKKLHPYLGTGLFLNYYGRNYQKDLFPYWIMGIEYQFANHFELKIENVNVLRLRLGIAYKF